MPKVGFVVPTLGSRIESLERCLKSIKSQAVPTFVVVVSPVSDLITNLPSGLVDLNLGQEAGGLAAAVNLGEVHLPPEIEFFGWLGDDDFLAPNSVGMALEKLSSEGRYSATVGRIVIIDELGEQIGTYSPNRTRMRFPLVIPNPYPQPGSFFRRSDFRQVGRLLSDLKFAMDLDIFLKLRQVGDIGLVEQTVAFYTWSEGTLSFENSHSADREAIAVRVTHTPRMFKSVNRLNLTLQANVAQLLRNLKVRNSRRFQEPQAN
jgi:glycosyltransferase involved in cell wall biosynthesis